MKPKIETIQNRIGRMIKDAVDASDFQKVSELTNKAKRLDEMRTKFSAMEIELTRIESDLNDTPSAETRVPPLTSQPTIESSPKSGRRRLSVAINWAENGYELPEETICENIAADTLAVLFERLHTIIGDRVLEIASEMRINRGPFISKSPTVDYVNGSNGSNYSFKKISGTSYSVLTHSQTTQKQGDVNELMRKLGLKKGSYQTKII